MPRGVLGIVLWGWIAACRPDAPPSLGSIGGVDLGEDRRTVQRALGDPDRRQQSLGLVFWDYETRGLTLLWDGDRDMLRAVVLKKADAGRLEGIGVGDSASSLRARWGEPARVRQDGRFLDFMRPRWTQTVEVRNGRIVEITVLKTGDEQ